MADIPSPMTWGTITGNFGALYADGPDVGVVPDLQTVSGTVTVTPRLSLVKILSIPMIAVAKTIQCQIVEGVLIGPDGTPGVRVVASDSPGIEPSPLQWEIRIQITGATTQPAPSVINVPTGAIVDLALALPAQTTVPVIEIVSVQTRLAAEAARDAAVAAAEAAQMPTDQAVDAGIIRANLPEQILTITNNTVPALVSAQASSQVPPLVYSTIGSDTTIVNAAAAAVKDAAVIAQISWTKGALPSTQDLNTLYTPGVYRSTNFASVTNLPPFANAGSSSGFVTITNSIDGTWAMQEIVRYGPSRERWWRVSRNTTGGWNPWQKSDVPTNVALLANSNLNTLKSPGMYSLETTAIVSTTLNTPIGATIGLVDVKATSGGIVFQTYSGSTATGKIWQRSLISVSTDLWTDWVVMFDPAYPPQDSAATPKTIVDGPYRREDIVSRHNIRRGGTIGTGGLPVVALRFDHHLDSFTTKILPLLKKYNLPWGQAVNPQRIGTYDDNVTWDNLQSMCLETGGEIWNHGGNHADATTTTDIYNQIVTSLETLRTNLPLLAIENWCPPGLSDGGYAGASPYKTVSQNTETYAGQLIMGNHAQVAGYAPGLYRILDGNMPVGAPHLTIEKSTLAQVITTLNDNTNKKTGLCIMMHPNYLDTEGYITTEILESMLAEIASRRNSGEIMVLSMSGLGLADMRHNFRHDLAPSGQTQRLVTAGNSMTVSILTNRAEQHLGSPREILISVNSSSATSCTISVGGSTPTTHTIASGQNIFIRKYVTFPLNSANIPIVVTPSSEITVNYVKALAA